MFVSDFEVGLSGLISGHLVVTHGQRLRMCCARYNHEHFPHVTLSLSYIASGIGPSFSWGNIASYFGMVCFMKSHVPIFIVLGFRDKQPNSFGKFTNV
jgi:hypothetical protein